MLLYAYVVLCKLAKLLAPSCSLQNGVNTIPFLAGLVVEFYGQIYLYDLARFLEKGKHLQMLIT